MKYLIISRVIFVTILGLGCMAVAGKADELEHPIELGAKRKAKFECSLSSIRWKNEYYKAFAYAYDAKGRYTCALSKGEGKAIESCSASPFA